MSIFSSDKDECLEDPGSCTQICENYQGSYMCKCADGYQKEPDGKTCKKKDGTSDLVIDCLNAGV